MSGLPSKEQMDITLATLALARLRLPLLSHHLRTGRHRLGQMVRIQALQ